MMTQLVSDNRVPSGEHLLADHVRRLAEAPNGWRALVMHMSRLQSDNRSTYRIRMATNVFEVLVKEVPGDVFRLNGGDLVFVFRSVNPAMVHDAVMKVRSLFADDPFASSLEDGHGTGFATWYDLEIEYRTFAESVEQAYAREAQRQRAGGGAFAQAQPARLPMEPQVLADLVAAVERADLTNMMRRQAICTIADGAAPRPILHETYVSIDDLRDTIMPGRDIASDRWLFKYLTQALDRRMLAQLRREQAAAPVQSLSINLNVSTVLSPEFLGFDANLRSTARGSIVIEIEKLEIFADLGAYVFARDFLHVRGYRVCLDGVTALTLSHVDRERLGLDLLKVFWSAELFDPRRVERLDEFRAALERAGKAHVILARCDTADAVAFGQSMGLRLFQGRHVDELLRNAMGEEPEALRAAGGAR
jgi:EAL domain-containing protein (putative c-di-GMP-specific phosphodiesterase class I)